MKNLMPLNDRIKMRTYIVRPYLVTAERFDGAQLKGFRKYQGEPFNHAVFDRYANGTGTLIVAIGEWVVYMPDGEIKSYTDEHFKSLFEAVPDGSCSITIKGQQCRL